MEYSTHVDLLNSESAYSLSKKLNLELNGPDLCIQSIGSLSAPSPGKLSFARNNVSYDLVKNFLDSKGVLFLTQRLAESASGTFMVSENPEEYFAKAINTITNYKIFQSEMYLVTAVNEMRSKDTVGLLKNMNSKIHHS